MATLVVGALVRDFDRVLLLRRAAHESLPGLWELPSGKVHEGEEALSALERELREETDMHLEHVCREVGNFRYTINGNERLQRNFVVEAGGRPTLSDEHDKCLFVGPENLDDIRVSDEVVEVIREACL